MTGISGVAGITRANFAALGSTSQAPDVEQLRLRGAFQDFVAGTFYKQMLKSLHRFHDKPSYFHGGQAEEIFQSQLDQQVAEDLARNQGAAFSDALFSAFVNNSKNLKRPQTVSPSTKTDSATATSAPTAPMIG